MPLLVLTWNLPPLASHEAYVEKARSAWIPSVLAQPGVDEIRAFRNGTQTKPDVITTVEFETFEALEAYMASKQYAGAVSGLRSAGCDAITAQVWDYSPVVPHRIRPERRRIEFLSSRPGVFWPEPTVEGVISRDRPAR